MKNRQPKNKSFSKNKSFDKNKNFGSGNFQNPAVNSSGYSRLIYGKHPVIAAILAKKRKIHKIFVTNKSVNELEQILAKNQVRIDPSLINIVDNNFLISNLPQAAVHQGFALKASEMKLTLEDDFIVEISKKEKSELPPILILDQLTDPHNIGAIIRSAMAFGVSNIVIPKHNFPKESAVMNKSSSGTIEMSNLILANNINNFMADVKKLGYWCVGLAGEATDNLSKAQEFSPIALVVGSEGDGIRDLVKKNCDLLVKIPMNSEVESLNASNAAAIALYELFAK